MQSSSRSLSVAACCRRCSACRYWSRWNCTTAHVPPRQPLNITATSIRAMHETPCQMKSRLGQHGLYTHADEFASDLQDNYDLLGLATTAGSVSLVDNFPAADAAQARPSHTGKGVGNLSGAVSAACAAVSAWRIILRFLNAACSGRWRTSIMLAPSCWRRRTWASLPSAR